MANFFSEKEILRIEDGKVLNIKDNIVKEEIYSVIFDGKELFSISASPVKVKEMALGRVYCEDLISSVDEIEEIILHKSKNIIELISNKHLMKRKKKESEKKNETKSNKNGNIFHQNKIKDSIIFKIINLLSAKSIIFKKTGGVHNALLTNYKGDELIFREDIARHNTIDKIIGFILKNNLNTEDKVLALSCRISTKIIEKALTIGLKVLVSQSPPSLKAVQIAERENITLIGFVREKRMNIYSHPEKVLY